MRFADPTSCPECRGVIAGHPACPQCGFDLSSIEARELWQTLLHADALLARAAQRPRVAPVPAANYARPSEPFVAVSPEMVSYPAPRTSTPAPPVDPSVEPAPHRPWPVGSILLVLGALGLIVAGLIFVTRSWDSIGLAGKASILLGVTAVMGGLGSWVTRRRLRASAEAVWAVFLALLTLDVFAARHEDLAGLGALDLPWMCVVWGVVALGVSTAIGMWSRPQVSTDLISPAVAGGLAITMAGVGAGAIGDDRDFAWRAFGALVVAGLLALTTRPAHLRILTFIARIVVAGFFAAAYIAALVELADHPALDDLVAGGHGAPLALMGLASFVVGWVVPVVRVPAVALGVVAASALVVTPVAEAGGEDAGWAFVAVLAAALAAAGSRGDNAWLRGVRLGAAPAVAGIVGLHTGLFAEVLETIGRILENPWQLGWDVRLDALVVENHAAWAVLVAVAALIVVAASIPRWPELAFARPHGPLILGASVAVGTVNAVVAWRLPLWAIAVVLLAVAAGMLFLHLRGDVTTLAAVAALVVVAAAFLAAGSQGVSSWAWMAGGVVLAGLAVAAGADWIRQICSALAVILVLAGIAALADLVTDEAFVTSLVVVVAALGLMACAGFSLRGHPVQIPVEVTSAIALLIGLVTAGSSAEVAVRWTVAGVALISLGFVIENRRWYVWPGIASLIVAYIAVIVDSGFSFVEAYTLPLGVAPLAAGLYVLRRKPDASTWTCLGPGLAVSMLPSIPQALADPTDLRALLLGLGAVAALAVGVRLMWQAPFVAGVVVIALLVLFNIGPYANAAPRVVVIAVVSAILLGVGITWEDRVRDGRKLAAHLRAMR